MPERYEAYAGELHLDGWTFTLNSLPYFGIHNVVYKGDDPYPTPRDEQTPEVLIYTPYPNTDSLAPTAVASTTANLPRPTRPPR